MGAEEEKPGTQGTELAALERFVVENDDLLTLESRIARFNIFDALGITRVEIRHSNFLAFIFDPVESHGQGQLFLKAVLMDLLKQAPPDLRPLSPIELDGTDLRGVEVKREWKNIDLLITSKEPRFAVVIENKVGAREHSNQLSRYQRTMTDYYSELPLLYVYLTPYGDEPSEDSWLPYTYADIHRVLTRIRDAHRNAIGDDVLVFLDHYLNLLGTRFMNDEKLDELCQQIYKNHRQALNLIWERVGNPEAAGFDEVLTALKEDSRWHIFSQAAKHIWFLPKTWLEWLPKLGPEEAERRSWIVVSLRSKKQRLEYNVQVMGMADMAVRKEIITKLREESSICGFKRANAKEVKNNFSRICAVERILEWGEDEEPEPDAIRLAMKETLDKLYPKLEKLALVLKPLCQVPTSST